MLLAITAAVPLLLQAQRPAPQRETPMISASDIHYELGRRDRGLAPGGIGALLLVARR